MGEIATTVLADTVVCLALGSLEHLEGLRALMVGISQTKGLSDSPNSVNILPVLSRLPLGKNPSFEEKELNRVREFLNSPVGDAKVSLNLGEVFSLHAEPLLDSEEQLLVGGKASLHESTLLRDYLVLFSKIIPADEIRPYVGQLIQRATARLLDDPDGAQSDLEALATYCADQEVYRALLKIYQLRKVPIEKLTATAALMWQLGGPSSASNQLLLDVVKTTYAEPRATDVQKKYAEFAEAVWRSSGMKDFGIGLTVANAYVPERRDRAIQLLTDYVEATDQPNSAAIVRLIDLLRNSTSPSRAFSVINRFKDLEPSSKFQAAWARLILDQKKKNEAQQVLTDPLFRVEAVKDEDPGTLYRLLRLAGEEPGPFLVGAIEAAVANEDFGRLRDLSEIMYEEGRFEEVEDRLRGRLPTHFVEDLRERLQRPIRSRLLTRRS